MKQFKKTNYIYLLLITLIFSCNTNNNTGFSIKGNIDGIPNSSKVYFTYKDSVGDRFQIIKETIDGTFEIKGPSQNFAWFDLTIQNNGKIIQQFSSFISNEKITLSGSINNMKFSGSKTIEDHLFFLEKRRPHELIIRDFFIKLDNLNKFRSTPQFEADKYDSIYSLYDEARKLKKKYELDLARKYPNKKMSTILLCNSLNSVTVNDVIEVDELLSDEAKSIPQYKKINAFINTEKLKVGDKAEGFEVLDHENEPLPVFKERTKDKYLILDFSAIGCTPCAEAKSELHEINQLFNDRIDITTILFSSNRKQLKSHIEKNENKWNFYRMSPKENPYEVEFKYHIIGKPQFVLINPEKKIEYIWPPGYKEGLLIEKVDEILNK